MQPVESATPEFAARCWLLAYEDGANADLATMFTDPQVRAGVQAQDLLAWELLRDTNSSGVSSYEFRCEDAQEGPSGAKWCWWYWPVDPEFAEYGPVTALRLTVVQLGDPVFWAVEDGFLGP